MAGLNYINAYQNVKSARRGSRSARVDRRRATQRRRVIFTVPRCPLSRLFPHAARSRRIGSRSRLPAHYPKEKPISGPRPGVSSRSRAPFVAVVAVPVRFLLPDNDIANPSSLDAGRREEAPRTPRFSAAAQCAAIPLCNGAARHRVRKDGAAASRAPKTAPRRRLQPLPFAANTASDHR